MENHFSIQPGFTRLEQQALIPIYDKITLMTRTHLPDAAAAAENQASESQGPIEVLVIDNDEAHAEVVAEALQRVGCRCQVATSGTQGARLIEEKHLRRDHYRPGDERHRRPGDPRPGQEGAARDGRDPHHRPRHDPLGRRRPCSRGPSIICSSRWILNQLRAITARAAEGVAAASHQRRAQAAAGRKVRLRGGGRRKPADARRDRAAQTHRPHQRQRADPGRDRHGQGAGGPGDPPEQPAEEQALRGPELRRLEREHPGKRAVRPRQRGLHRRLDRPRGQVRVRPRRHAVSGRSGRHAPGHADQAAARAGERRDHPRGLQRPDQGQRADPLGHQPQPGRRDRGRHASAATSITGSRW